MVEEKETDFGASAVADASDNDLGDAGGASGVGGEGFVAGQGAKMPF